VHCAWLRSAGAKDPPDELVDVLEEPDDVEVAGGDPTLYKFRRDAPPHISAELPAQGFLQVLVSLAGDEADRGFNVHPSQHSLPFRGGRRLALAIIAVTKAIRTVLQTKVRVPKGLGDLITFLSSHVIAGFPFCQCPAVL
jgi:hypothetical protein